MKILVSHESPLELLEISRLYNDYDYCLVHLLPTQEKYRNFFFDSKEMGRKILLDNSMFELREAFEASQFAGWINDLRPDEYIVPDVFSDSQKTIDSFKAWQDKYGGLPGKKIGVVQGLTYQEMINCYQFMSENADKIAISFECKYFHSIGTSKDPYATVWEKLMNGRVKFLKDLSFDEVWNWQKPHHLLGCALPQEFKNYTFSPDNVSLRVGGCIESIDTSNPIVAGMHNVRYNSNGLKDKISHKLADLIDAKLTPENIKNIIFNIKEFRNINYL